MKTPATGFRLTQGFYNLSLGVWLGAMVMLVISAAVTFATVRNYQPVLTAGPGSDPALTDQFSNILAGAIVGRSLSALVILQTICALVAILALVAQATLYRRWLLGKGRQILRAALIAAPVALLIYNVAVVSPAVSDLRATMYDDQATAEVRAAARLDFQGWHKTSERTHGLAAACLLLAMLVSPFAFALPTGETTDG